MRLAGESAKQLDLPPFKKAKRPRALPGLTQEEEPADTGTTETRSEGVRTETVQEAHHQLSVGAVLQDNPLFEAAELEQGPVPDSRELIRGIIAVSGTAEESSAVEEQQQQEAGPSSSRELSIVVYQPAIHEVVQRAAGRCDQQASTSSQPVSSETTQRVGISNESTAIVVFGETGSDERPASPSNLSFNSAHSEDQDIVDCSDTDSDSELQYMMFGVITGTYTGESDVSQLLDFRMQIMRVAQSAGAAIKGIDLPRLLFQWANLASYDSAAHQWLMATVPVIAQEKHIPTQGSLTPQQVIELARALSTRAAKQFRHPSETLESALKKIEMRVGESPSVYSNRFTQELESWDVARKPSDSYINMLYVGGLPPWLTDAVSLKLDGLQGKQLQVIMDAAEQQWRNREYTASANAMSTSYRAGASPAAFLDPRTPGAAAPAALRANMTDVRSDEGSALLQLCDRIGRLTETLPEAVKVAAVEAVGATLQHTTAATSGGKSADSRPGGGKGNNVRFKTKPRELSEVQCYNCEEYGHYARDCSKPKKAGAGPSKQTQGTVNSPSTVADLDTRIAVQIQQHVGAAVTSAIQQALNMLDLSNAGGNAPAVKKINTCSVVQQQAVEATFDMVWGCSIDDDLGCVSSDMSACSGVRCDEPTTEPHIVNVVASQVSRDEYAHVFEAFGGLTDEQVEQAARKADALQETTTTALDKQDNITASAVAFKDVLSFQPKPSITNTEAAVTNDKSAGMRIIPAEDMNTALHQVLTGVRQALRLLLVSKPAMPVTAAAETVVAHHEPVVTKIPAKTTGSSKPKVPSTLHSGAAKLEWSSPKDLPGDAVAQKARLQDVGRCQMFTDAELIPVVLGAVTGKAPMYLKNRARECPKLNPLAMAIANPNISEQERNYLKHQLDRRVDLPYIEDGAVALVWLGLLLYVRMMLDSGSNANVIVLSYVEAHNIPWVPIDGKMRTAGGQLEGIIGYLKHPLTVVLAPNDPDNFAIFTFPLVYVVANKAPIYDILVGVHGLQPVLGKLDVVRSIMHYCPRLHLGDYHTRAAIPLRFDGEVPAVMTTHVQMSQPEGYEYDEEQEFEDMINEPVGYNSDYLPSESEVAAVEQSSQTLPPLAARLSMPLDTCKEVRERAQPVNNSQAGRGRSRTPSRRARSRTRSRSRIPSRSHSAARTMVTLEDQEIFPIAGTHSDGVADTVERVDMSLDELAKHRKTQEKTAVNTRKNAETTAKYRERARTPAKRPNSRSRSRSCSRRRDRSRSEHRREPGPRYRSRSPLRQYTSSQGKPNARDFRPRGRSPEPRRDHAKRDTRYDNEYGSKGRDYRRARSCSVGRQSTRVPSSQPRKHEGKKQVRYADEDRSKGGYHHHRDNGQHNAYDNSRLYVNRRDHGRCDHQPTSYEGEYEQTGTGYNNGYGSFSRAEERTALHVSTWGCKPASANHAENSFQQPGPYFPTPSLQQMLFTGVNFKQVATDLVLAGRLRAPGQGQLVWEAGTSEPTSKALLPKYYDTKKLFKPTWGSDVVYRYVNQSMNITLESYMMPLCLATMGREGWHQSWHPTAVANALQSNYISTLHVDAAFLPLRHKTGGHGIEYYRYCVYDNGDIQVCNPSVIEDLWQPDPFRPSVVEDAAYYTGTAWDLCMPEQAWIETTRPGYLPLLSSLTAKTKVWHRKGFPYAVDYKPCPLLQQGDDVSRYKVGVQPFPKGTPRTKDGFQSVHFVMPEWEEKPLKTWIQWECRYRLTLRTGEQREVYLKALFPPPWATLPLAEAVERGIISAEQKAQLEQKAEVAYKSAIGKLHNNKVNAVAASATPMAQPHPGAAHMQSALMPASRQHGSRLLVNTLSVATDTLTAASSKDVGAQRSHNPMDQGMTSHECRIDIHEVTNLRIEELLPDGIPDPLAIPLSTVDKELGVTWGNHPCMPADDLQAIKEAVYAQRDVFAFSVSECTGYTGRFPAFEVELTQQDVVLFQKPRPHSAFDKQQIALKCQELLDADFIVKCDVTEHAHNVVIVAKKNDAGELAEFRMCIDFRALNSVTKPDRHSMPPAADLFILIAQASYFTKIDMRASFNQAIVGDKSRPLLAFWWGNSTYTWKRMPFGLRNATAYFQRLMEYELAKAGLNDVAVCFVDDLLVYTKTSAEHVTAVRQVLQMLRACGLKAHPKKSTFAANVVEYLGHNVSAHGLTPTEAQILAITSMPEPQDVPGLQSALGKFNYYREFCPDFACIADPLYSLLRKGVRYVWGPAQQQAFDSLKQEIRKGRLLRRIDPNRALLLHTDWSKVGIGAILGQLDDDGKEYICACISRRNNKSERNYSSYQGEMLAAVWAIKTLHIHLHGVVFILITDHQPLQWLMTSKNLTGQYARWALALQSYQFTVVHRPGAKHQNADGLSRNPLPSTHDTTGARLDHDVPSAVVAEVDGTQLPEGPVLPLIPGSDVVQPNPEAVAAAIDLHRRLDMVVMSVQSMQHTAPLQAVSNFSTLMREQGLHVYEFDPLYCGGLHALLRNGLRVCHYEMLPVSDIVGQPVAALLDAHNRYSHLLSQHVLANADIVGRAGTTVIPSPRDLHMVVVVLDHVSTQEQLDAVLQACTRRLRYLRDSYCQPLFLVTASLAHGVSPSWHHVLGEPAAHTEVVVYTNLVPADLVRSLPVGAYDTMSTLAAVIVGIALRQPSMLQLQGGSSASINTVQLQHDEADCAEIFACNVKVAMRAEARDNERSPETGVDIWEDTSAFQYLRYGTMEPDTPAAERRRIMRRASLYRWVGNKLFRKLPNGDKECPSPDRRWNLVKQLHESCGHFGIKRTLHMALLHYWWRGMTELVKQVISQCEACARINTSFNCADPQLHPLPIEGLFYRWGGDLFGPLPASKYGNTYCFIMIEYFTKWIEVYPIPDKSAVHTTRGFISCVLARFGAPAEVVTDGGREFMGEFQELLDKAFIDHRVTSPNHPQADGLAERGVQTLKSALRKYVSKTGDEADWEQGLYYAVLGYNVSPQASSKYAPYQLLHCTTPVFPPAIRKRLECPLDFKEPEDCAAALLARSTLLQQMHLIAGGNLRIAAHRDTLRYAMVRGGGYKPKLRKFEVGDFVYLRQPNPKGLMPYTRSAIFKVHEVRPTGVLLLQGRCGLTTTAHITNCAPCHLTNIDPTVDHTLARPSASKACIICSFPDDEQVLLLCDACGEAYHTYCLEPKLDVVPLGVWICPPCIRAGRTEADVLEAQQKVASTEDVRDQEDPASNESIDPDKQEEPGKVVTNKQRDERAKELDGRIIIETRIIKGQTQTRWGKLQYMGAKRRPYYYDVHFEGSTRPESWSYTKAVRRLQPLGTVLPNERETSLVSNVMVDHTKTILPASWQAGVYGLLNALQMLMPGSWSWEDALSLRASLSTGPQYAVTTADMQALLSVVQLKDRIETVHNLWSKDDTGLSDLLARTLGKRVVCLEDEDDVVTGLPASLLPTTYRRLREEGNVIKYVIGHPRAALLDLALPIAAMHAEVMVGMLVPSCYVSNAPVARAQWLDALSQQQRLLRITGDYVMDSSEGSREWLCIFADQHWLSHLCQPISNARFVSSFVVHVESKVDGIQAPAPSPAVSKKGIEDSKTIASRERKSYEVLTLLKSAFEQMNVKKVN